MAEMLARMATPIVSAEIKSRSDLMFLAAVRRDRAWLGMPALDELEPLGFVFAHP